MKKVFSILMIIAVLFCFSACSSSLQASSGERSTTETSSRSTEQTSTAAQETQALPKLHLNRQRPKTSQKHW
ncbi:MAG: hypothetical protein MSH60_03075 [Ruminococcus sp.]|nr:hypothetical protein [Ruminococcus sp.]